MRRDNINYLAVGLFVLVSTSVLLVSLYRVTGQVGDSDAYYIYLEDVTGLNKGSGVTYQGYRIGYVDNIVPVQENVHTRYRIELKVEAGWKISEHSVARMTATGLLSKTAVNISEGKGPGMLDTGSEIAAAHSDDIFGVLRNVAVEVDDLTQNIVRPLLETVTGQVESIGSEVNARLPAILSDMESMAGRLDKSATYLQAMLNESTADRVERILGNADDAAANLSNLSGRLVETQASFDEFLHNSTELLEDSEPEVRRSIRSMRRSIDTLARSLDAIFSDLQAASRNVNEFSREIRQNPGVLLHGKPKTEKGDGGA